VRFKKGDRVRYVSGDYRRIDHTGTIAEVNSTSYDVKFDDGSSGGTRFILDQSLEPLDLIDPDRPIVTGDRPFTVHGKFEHPVHGTVLVGNVPGGLEDYPIFVSPRTGKVVARYPDDRTGAALTFKNVPKITTTDTEVFGLPVTVTYLEGIAVKVEQRNA